MKQDIQRTLFSHLLYEEVELCREHIYMSTAMKEQTKGAVRALYNVLNAARLKKKYLEYRTQNADIYHWKPEYEQRLKELMG